MRPPRPTWIVAVAIAGACALALSGCGSSSSSSTPAGTTSSTPTVPATTAPATTAPTTTPAPATVPTAVYFVRDEKMAAAGRSVTPPAVARAAMLALLSGPSAAESAAGMTSSIPPGTTLLGLRIVDGVARVDLSADFGSGGGSLSMLTRVAQVVHTLTAFPTVRAVRFLIDGAPVDSIGGEGVIVDHPLTRADVEDQAPAILIESPTEGATVAGPLRVRGTANTFEATLQLRLTSASGAVLAEQTVTATSGSGTRGTFSASLPFSVSSPQDATLTGFVQSAKDGSEVNTVTVGLHLQP